MRKLIDIIKCSVTTEAEWNVAPTTRKGQNANLRAFVLKVAK